MAKEETYLMVSLEEEKSKQLAHAISNETSRKILDYLGKNQEASASQLSKALKVPISTVDYNIKQLIKSGLIEAKEFMWSPKGREMYLYKIAKKLIVISPSKTNIKKELKNILPVALISAAFVGIGHFFYTRSNAFATGLVEKVADTQEAPEIITTIPNYALWFLIGALFASLLLFIWRIVKK